MTPTKLSRPSTPRAFVRECGEFQRGVNDILKEQLRIGLDHLIAPQNKLRLRHGRGWSAGRPEVAGDYETAFKQSSASTETSLPALVGNDVQLLPAFIDELTSGLVREISANIYEAVSKAADSVGNVISRKAAGSDSAAFLEMIRKVEFGVDHEGRVTMPAVHTTPEDSKKFIEELQAQPPEFHAQIEQLKQQKAAEALERERQRRAKYKKRPE